MNNIGEIWDFRFSEYDLPSIEISKKKPAAPYEQWRNREKWD